MNEGAHPPTRPLEAPELDDRGTPDVPPGARSLRGVVALCLGSLAVMAPWPLLATLLTRSSFDDSGEAILLFGGITAIPVVILTALGLPEAMFELLVIGVWCAAAVVPDVWLARRLTSWQTICWLLGVQTAFSFAQAVMGALMIFGKDV